MEQNIGSEENRTFMKDYDPERFVGRLIFLSFFFFNQRLFWVINT